MPKALNTFFIVAVVLLIAGTAWWALPPNVSDSSPAATPTPAPPAAAIRFSGEVVAKQSANLGFEVSGVTETVDIQVGDRVTAGQTLVTLDRELESANVAGAYANRVAARDQALIALETARASLSKTEAENTQTIATARQKVIDTKAELGKSKAVFGRTADEDGDEAATTATKELAVTTAEKAYNNAQDALATARATASKENTAAAEAVRAAEAAYTATNQASINAVGTSALGALENATRVQLARKILTAPFTGTVTKLNVDPGELAVAGQSVITVQALDDLEISAQVSETDISALAVGDKADITFDAFTPDLVWPAVITRIDPAGEKQDGIPRFQVYLDIKDNLHPEHPLRPAFTANITIP